MSKPKVFWINGGGSSWVFEDDAEFPGVEECRGYFSVIEKSAYDKLKEELGSAYDTGFADGEACSKDELREENEKLVEALKDFALSEEYLSTASEDPMWPLRHFENANKVLKETGHL